MKTTICSLLAFNIVVVYYKIFTAMTSHALFTFKQDLIITTIMREHEDHY